MKAVVLTNPGKGVDAWRLVDRAAPTPGPGEVLVRVRAASLNYRDLMVAKGLYGGPAKEGLVALADAAGEIAALGAGVTGWRVGDRVMSAYYPSWQEGPYRPRYEGDSLGIGGRDGVLAEYAALSATGVVAAPPHLSFEEAATLPCAAVTAWQALFEGAGRLPPGATVLLSGTGGVSLFAAQLALAAGMRVIATTSSERKVPRLHALGVREVIDSRARPEWQDEVRRLTDGEGVDLVVDVGGGSTLGRALEAVRVGGRIAVVGLLGGFGERIDPLPILFRAVTVEGVHVGSVAMFERLARAVGQAALAPVIDEVFDLEAAPRALGKLAAGAHFGKVVVRVP